MTRPIEPLHPCHPAHIVHHQHCDHVLRRIYKLSPEDPSQTGCICSSPPEEIVRPICLERGGIPCRIDEVTYETVSVPAECNFCAAVGGRCDGDGDSRMEDEITTESEAVNKEREGEAKSAMQGVKKGRKKGKGSSENSKKGDIAYTPGTKLNVGFSQLGLQSPSASGSGSDSSASKKSSRRRKSSKKPKEAAGDNAESIEERVWKYLRSGPVSGF
ncbi:hypothetical protein TWF730_002427 [Orbilia blumenaviensis]|uniref:Uncharacterized protein n=1 Tax=Orbilia blumenaviensis TaxID=1796055 RepID=A0AAV9UA52_9PEZI